MWLWRHSLVWHFVVIGVRPNRRRPRRNPLTWVPNETVVYQHLKLVVIFPEEGRWRRNGKCSCLILGVESRSKSWRSHTQDFILADLRLESQRLKKHLHSSHHLMLKNLPHTNQLVHPGCCVLFVQARFGWQGYYLVLAQITIWFLFTCYRRLYCWRRSHGHHAWERQTQIVIKRELYNVNLSRYHVFLDWNLISLYLNLYLRSSTFS